MLKTLDFFPESCYSQPFFFCHINDRCTCIQGYVQFLGPSFFYSHFHPIQAYENTRKDIIIITDRYRFDLLNVCLTLLLCTTGKNSCLDVG